MVVIIGSDSCCLSKRGKRVVKNESRPVNKQIRNPANKGDKSQKNSGFDSWLIYSENVCVGAT